MRSSCFSASDSCTIAAHSLSRIPRFSKISVSSMRGVIVTARTNASQKCCSQQIVREGTPAEQEPLLDADWLREMPEIHLADRCQALWEGRFPELARYQPCYETWVSRSPRPRSARFLGGCVSWTATSGGGSCVAGRQHRRALRWSETLQSICRRGVDMFDWSNVILLSNRC